MPVEILTASLRREWERFPEEIDEATLSAFFSFADDELELIAGHRGVHGRFAMAVAVGAVRWLGFVPAALAELPEPAAALVASQLDIDLSSIDPKRLHVERDARAEQLAQVMTVSRFRACRDADLDKLGSWVANRALGHDGPLALLRSTVDELRRRKLIRGRWIACSTFPRQRLPRRSSSSARKPGRSGRSVSRSRSLSCCADSAPSSGDLEIIPANRRRMLGPPRSGDPRPQGSRRCVAPRDSGGAAARARARRRDQTPAGRQPSAAARRALPRHPRLLASRPADARLRANPDGEKLLEAVEVLRELNRRGARRVPDDAPVGFVPRSWRPYVRQSGGGIDRHHWELCLLSELRGALRAGEIWVVGSRRYTDPERLLIPRGEWATARPDVVRELELPSSAEPRLEQLRERTAAHRDQLDRDLKDADADITIDEHSNLSVKRLRAEPREPDVDELTREIANQLPVIDLPDLPDLLIEVNRWCNFTRHLTHAGGSTPRREDHLRHLVAAIIAQACNLGTGRMARASDLSPAQVGWTSEWYLRHDTLEPATGAIVDYQSTIGLAQRMGSGEHSSSDGKRRIVSPDSQQARALPRYFGRDRGLTHYTFVSDQHTHFATRVIRTTVRDATYVRDGILDNRSQLPIRIHSTDTAGYSDIIFALFDLLGLRFAPRLAGLPDTRLWGGWPAHNSPAGRMLRHRVRLPLIREQWDAMLRLAESLHTGAITASLLVARLHAQQRRTVLAAALQDYGRLVKTEFILRYLTRPPERRGISASSTSARASTHSKTPSSTATKAASGSRRSTDRACKPRRSDSCPPR